MKVMVHSIPPECESRDVSRLGMNREALRIPVPVTPDLRPGVGAVDKRIVGGNAAVVMDSVDGAMVVGDILGGVSLQISAGRYLSFSDRDDKEAVTAEGESRTVMSATSRHRVEDFFYIPEAIVLEPTRAPPPWLPQNPRRLAWRNSGREGGSKRNSDEVPHPEARPALGRRPRALRAPRPPGVIRSERCGVVRGAPLSACRPREETQWTRGERARPPL